jgi:hypothetical protein
MDKRKEVYTLRDLFHEYEQIQRDILTKRLETLAWTRELYAPLREKLEIRFGNDIGFQSRYRRNESSIVFWRRHGGAYVESAVNSWGTNISNLIQNVAKTLHAKYRTMPGIQTNCRTTTGDEFKRRFMSTSNYIRSTRNSCHG